MSAGYDFLVNSKKIILLGEEVIACPNQIQNTKDKYE